MSYSKHEIQWVFERMKGHCFYCGMQIIMSNYQLAAQQGAWAINNFIPAQRIIEHRQNWVPACLTCHAEKGQCFPWEYDPARFRPGDKDPDNYNFMK